MNDDMSVRWGATLPLVLTNDEEGADTATITISLDDSVELTKTVNFDGLVADLTLSAEEMEITPAEYKYMITVVYEDGTVEKYPDLENCSDCELPTLEICDTNDNPEVS